MQSAFSRIFLDNRISACFPPIFNIILQNFRIFFHLSPVSPPVIMRKKCDRKKNKENSSSLICSNKFLCHQSVPK